MHERVLHYFGQQGARLLRDQTIYSMEEQRRPSYWFLVLSYLLFFEPDVYLKKLWNMYVDDMINEGPWNRFWDDMRRDWERATTPVSSIIDRSLSHADVLLPFGQVTVLLSTNVGLLAISSIDQPDGNIPTHRSVAQIASYVSAVLSLACYLICWILSRQHPPGVQATAGDAVSGYILK